jgi:IclR-like helix-turn-helix domain-containing protein
MTETAAKAHRTVSRVTAILEFVAQWQGARTHELATALGAPKSSVFGLVRGLVSTGFLINDKGTYGLGPALGNLLLRKQQSDQLTSPCSKRVAGKIHLPMGQGPYPVWVFRANAAQWERPLW